MNIYMKRAIELAEQAACEGEVPVGAVIVRKTTGEIVGEGRNMRENKKNALAHAEIIAIDMACRTLGGWRLPECEIYVTLEPCPMCCGAIINARIDNVIFGAYDLKSGSVESVQKMFELPYNYRPQVTSGIMEKECSDILSLFFRNLRKKKKFLKNFSKST
ncbi:MAG: nucleoside deaminase [Prevotella sp.]|nr:nucleoside deaminase [Alistipes senegalensis]MCM1358177.1 nucleoside deaminase [Prevotella sp.]MCM1473764.1 nucleoside deaminase [Muribaculaceae bacterium]MDE6425507.1 nucleoside deaminase [Ruminococcus sp.]